MLLHLQNFGAIRLQHSPPYGAQLGPGGDAGKRRTPGRKEEGAWPSSGRAGGLRPAAPPSPAELSPPPLVQGEPDRVALATFNAYTRFLPSLLSFPSLPSPPLPCLPARLPFPKRNGARIILKTRLPMVFCLLSRARDGGCVGIWRKRTQLVGSPQHSPGGHEQQRWENTSYLRPVRRKGLKFLFI